MPEQLWFDAAATDHRFQALRQYCEDEAGIDPGEFRCSRCEKLATPKGCTLVKGGLAHVGEDYDTSVALRVMFVGYDYGNECAGLRERRDSIQNIHKIENLHYSGIMKVLIEIFQSPCRGAEDESKWQPLLRRMVQTNATRCCAPSNGLIPGRLLMKCNTTDAMRKACWIHFKKEIELLEPSVIFFHGADLKGSFLANVRQEDVVLDEVSNNKVSGTAESNALKTHCKQMTWSFSTQHSVKSLLLFFHHPSYRHFGKQWENVLLVLKSLRQQELLPTLDHTWTGRARDDWPPL